MKITVSVGRTFNLGNYESARYEFSIEDTVPAGAKPSDVKEKLKLKCEEWLNIEKKALESKSN